MVGFWFALLQKKGLHCSCFSAYFTIFFRRIFFCIKPTGDCFLKLRNISSVMEEYLLYKNCEKPNVSLELFSQNGFPEVAFSSLRQILPTKSPLKMIKNTFYFTWKALLVLKIFQFLLWIFGYVIKRVDMKVNVNFKTSDVTN